MDPMQQQHTEKARNCTVAEACALTALGIAREKLREAQVAVTAALPAVAQLEAERGPDESRLSSSVAEARSHVANSQRIVDTLESYAVPGRMHAKEYQGLQRMRGDPDARVGAAMGEACDARVDGRFPKR